MLENNDPRLFNGQDYLKNAVLEKKQYVKKSENWDHEHCVFCFDKFSENCEDLHIGYCTSDENIWICEKCFNDFKDLFGFKTE